MKIKALILDLDFTLVDASKGIHLCIQYAMRHMGYPEPDYQTSAQTIGLSLPDTFRFITKKESPEEEKIFDQLFVEHAKQVLIDNTQLLDAAYTFIETAKQQGYKLSIVTSKYRSGLNDILKKFHLNHFFDFHIAGDEIEYLKPHPMSIERALHALNIQQEEAVYIGDSIIDAKAASNAHVKFIGVLTGKTNKEAFKDYPSLAITENLSHVLELIKPLQA